MKYKNLVIITIFSVIACGIYTIVLNSQYNSYVYTSGLKAVMFLAIPLIYFAISKEGKFRHLFAVRGNTKYIKISLLLSLVVFMLIIITYALLYNFFDRQMIVNALLSEGITASVYPFVFVYIVLINAALEEVFFRGFIFLTLYKLGFKCYSYIFSSLLFAFYHISMINSWFSSGIFLLCMAGLVGAGLIFSELDRRCENITGGFLLHLGANLAINLIGVYLLYF